MVKEKKGTMQISDFVKTHKVDPNSVIRSIQTIGLKVNESSDPLLTANRIIMSLGGSPLTNPIDARIMAQALTEQLLVQKDAYDTNQAISIATEKLNKIKSEMPFIYATKESDVNTATADGKRASRKTNDKKAKAFEIFEQNRDKKESDVAKLIQNQLGITFANAYYYVNRVFKGK